MNLRDGKRNTDISQFGLIEKDLECIPLAFLPSKFSIFAPRKLFNNNGK